MNIYDEQKLLLKDFQEYCENKLEHLKGNRIKFVQTQNFIEAIKVKDIISSLENLIINLDRETKLNNARLRNERIKEIFTTKKNEMNNLQQATVNNQLTPKSLWIKFIDSFKKTISHGIEHSQLNDKKSRTNFYRELIPKIFNEMKIELGEDFVYKTETHSRVDHSLIYKGPLVWDVPIILIEIENDAKPDANFQEINKMCYLNAPLKLIFLFTNWADNIDDIVDRYWKDLINNYIGKIGVVGIIGVCVLDTTGEKAKYYIHKIIEDNKFISVTEKEHLEYIEID